MEEGGSADDNSPRKRGRNYGWRSAKLNYDSAKSVRRVAEPQQATISSSAGNMDVPPVIEDSRSSSRRILFVADDPHLHRFLRQLMEPLEEEWRPHYSRGGPEALRQLEDGPYAIIMADVRLAAGFCQELLLQARQQTPQTVRIVLAGPGDQDLLLRVLPLVQRILSKPCDPAELYATLQRTQSLRELLRSPSVMTVVGRLGQIPTLSTLYSRIADELMKPDYSLAKVGELVSQDPGIAAKLLQVANSALIGLRRPATTPAQAVRVLGGELTRTLVLAADLFSRYSPAQLKPFCIDQLWEHSQSVATLAGRIAQHERLDERNTRDSTLAGLFHDIGQLLLASQLPETYREVFHLVRRENMSLAKAEHQVFGATHAEVGAYLLGLWGLPDPLVEAVAWHHIPEQCPGTTVSPLTTVHAAEALLSEREGERPHIDYLERLGLDDHWERWQELSRKAEAVSREVPIK
ncbi:MAG: two-component system response regulator [Gemmataceae bacterium]|nr:MAG: two-component system response regulator [Gemmataceae bacterium]